MTMPYSPEFDFSPWLNEDTSENGISLSKLGLKSDAPPDAVDAYKKYCDAHEDAKRRGAKM